MRSARQKVRIALSMPSTGLEFEKAVQLRADPGGHFQMLPWAFGELRRDPDVGVFRLLLHLENPELWPL